MTSSWGVVLQFKVSVEIKTWLPMAPGNGGGSSSGRATAAAAGEMNDCQVKRNAGKTV